MNLLTVAWQQRAAVWKRLENDPAVSRTTIEVWRRGGNDKAGLSRESKMGWMETLVRRDWLQPNTSSKRDVDIFQMRLGIIVEESLSY